MGLLSPPNTSYTDFYDQARYKLVWNVSMVFASMILILSVLSLSYDNYEPTSYIIALVFSIGAIVTLGITRRYEIISKIIAIGGLGIVSYTFLGLSNVINYTTPMWLVINVLFTYFTCGRRWGGTILGLNIVVITIYFYFKFQDNIAGLPVYTDWDMHLFVIEYGIIGIIMGYFLHMFVTTNYLAERKVKSSNQELNAHNSLITKQNEEKEVMLKEIHHRVKNNLQVITSLLRLQSYEIEDEKSRVHFTEAIDRIKAMALIHEKMYKKEMLENFDLESYVNSLADDLLETYSVGRKIEFNIESSIDHLGSKTIVPLALLFNELISNSLKHAFVDTEKPLIKVIIKDVSSDEFELIFADNGKWKESGKASFGQELISSMTDQLDGTYRLTKSSDGTRYDFNLKNLREKFDETNH